VAGLVLIAAPVSFVHNERASYDSALAWAKRIHNDTAVKELEQVGPPPHASYAEISAYRKWAAQALPMTSFSPDIPKVLAAGRFAAPDSNWQDAAMRVALAMLPALAQSDLRPGLSQVHWPLLAMAGGRDAIVLPAPMFEDLRAYGGPKRFVTFAASDHFLFMEEPERFAAEINRFLAEVSAKR
jgi:pimeloyl-ACP methyl ester carboxylesterase